MSSSQDQEQHQDERTAETNNHDNQTDSIEKLRQSNAEKDEMMEKLRENDAVSNPESCQSVPYKRM